jgi:hypothetical protein
MLSCQRVHEIMVVFALITWWDSEFYLDGHTKRITKVISQRLEFVDD